MLLGGYGFTIVTPVTNMFTIVTNVWLFSTDTKQIQVKLLTKSSGYMTMGHNRL